MKNKKLMRVNLRVFAAMMFFTLVVWAQPVCHCDPKDPETLKDRSCALCLSAESATTPVFFAQDISPRKPNRWLAMPREHASGTQHLADLSPVSRAELW